MQLRRLLLAELIQTKDHCGRQFISATALQKLINIQNVRDCLHACGIISQPDLIIAIVTKAPRLFSILVLIERVYHVPNLILRGLDDENIPLGEADLLLEGEEGQHEFFTAQRAFPPIFEKHRRLEISRDIVLPFLEKTYVNHGTFGHIYKVEVAYGHLPEYTSVRPSKLSSSQLGPH